jgi:hypothetical protein
MKVHRINFLFCFRIQPERSLGKMDNAGFRFAMVLGIALLSGLGDQSSG